MHVALTGIPFDEHSSFMRGPAKAPPKIVEALFSPSSNLATETGVDLGATDEWSWTGELEESGGKSVYACIEGHIAKLLETGNRVLSLGGDHSVTYPILRAYAESFPELTLVQLDAHPDLYDEFNGSRLSHGCPFARIMEDGLVQRLIQVGIRTRNPLQKEQAERFGVETIEARTFSIEKMPRLTGPVYLSVDLDVLDPAFAPGVSHHEPGGLSTREVLSIIQHLGGSIVGADIVELNPDRDFNGISAMVAAKITREILDRMILRK
jgi:arginase